MLAQITYRDPATGEMETVVEEFQDTETVTAYEWAEDYAYAVSDKGGYTIKVLTASR